MSKKRQRHNTCLLKLGSQFFLKIFYNFLHHNYGMFNTLPSICPATPDCQITRLSGKFCKAQGRYEPRVCALGWYCPTFNSTYKCPDNYFCPLGSIAPVECPWLSRCTSGLQRIQYGPLLLCVCFDSALAILLLLKHCGCIWAKRSPTDIPTIHDVAGTVEMPRDKEISPCDSMRSHNDGGVYGSVLIQEIPSPIAMLARNFARANSSIDGRILNFNISFSNFQMRLPQPLSSIVLANASGYLSAGRMTAILGPSGAGKTTLLNCILGRIDRTAGVLMINENQEEMNHFQKIIGFVSQSDELLGLWSARHTLCGDASGGERKRCSIGVELAAAPVALFLDEPTSGLDATTALEVCSLLTRIASLGVTVVSVIHQPRAQIFDCFDELILMGCGGHVLYGGPRSQSGDYFSSLGFVLQSGRNVADEIMDIISGARELPVHVSTHPLDLPVMWKEHQSTSAIVPKDISPGTTLKNDNFDPLIEMRGASFIDQCWLSFCRALLQQWRKPAEFALELGVALLAGGIMGAAVVGLNGNLYQGIFLGTYALLSPAPLDTVVPQLALFVGLAVGLAGAPAGVRIFGEERLVTRRESFARHSLSAYYLGKLFAALPRITAVAAHFAALFYLMASPRGDFASYAAVVWLEFFAVYGLAVVVSMVVSRPNMSLLAVVLCLFAGVFCGYGPRLTQARKWNITFLMDSSYARWGAEAIYTLEILPFSGIFRVFDVSAPQFGYTLDRYATDLGWMTVIGFIYWLLAYILLDLRHRQQWS